MSVFSVPFPLWEVVVVAVIALLICVLSTSMAMESAALFVPAFVIFFPSVLPHFPSVGVNEAIGLTLIIMFFGQTSATFGYWVRGQIDVNLTRTVLFLTIPFAIVGRTVSHFLPDQLLLVIFTGLLLGLSGVIYHHTSVVPGEDQRNPSQDQPSSQNSPSNRYRLGFSERVALSGGGGVTGLVGLGMGEVCNTVLTTTRGVPVHRSIGTSTLVLYLTVFSAAITNLLLVRFGGPVGIQPTIPWDIAVIIAPVVLVGGQLGPYINSKLPGRVIIRLLIGLYIVVAIVTVIRVFG